MSSWITLSGVALEEYHQDQIIAYQTSTSSKDVAFLYLKHKALCHFCNSSVINCSMYLSNDWVEWSKQVHSLSTIFTKAFLESCMIRIAFQWTFWNWGLQDQTSASLGLILSTWHVELLWIQIACTNYNGEHFVVHQVVNMTSHGGSFLKMLDIIKHQPTILQSTTKLHVPHQINPMLAHRTTF